MTHENDAGANSVFEGPEKLLEVWFAPSAADVPDAASAKDGKFGLRKVARSVWEDMLEVVKCKVLSVIEGTEMDAYLLSESSLFISPHRIILKTCGTTLNLLGLPRILEIARDQASLHSVYRCFYSRKAFMFPERQLGPHRHWKDEVEFLDGIFPNGAAYTVGKVNGDHWLLYLTCPEIPPNSHPEMPTATLAENQITENGSAHDVKLGPFAQDYTIEILMSDLAPERCQPFLSQQYPDAHKNTPTTPASRAQLLSSTLGIAHIFPPHLTTLDAHSFSPCGYSANALIKWDDDDDQDDHTGAADKRQGCPGREGYYTIHVTPEEGSSYASFECNVPLQTSTRSPSPPCQTRSATCLPDLQTLVKRVVGIFQPSRLCLTMFISIDESHGNSGGGGDKEEEGSDSDESAVEATQKAFKAALTPTPASASEENPADGEQARAKRCYYKRTDKINYEFALYGVSNVVRGSLEFCTGFIHDSKADFYMTRRQTFTSVIPSLYTSMLAMDIDTRPDLVTREFLVVVLAGFGNKLLPLTGDHGGEPSPKALLPIANKPMLDYVLSWIEESGVRDVLLICPAVQRPSISHHLHSSPFSSLSIDLQTYDESRDSSMGTCTLLRHFSSRITNDFVLLPCDFIPPPSLPLSVLLNKFRIHSASDGSMATTCWYAQPRPEKDVNYVDEWGTLASPASILWDRRTEILLHIDTSDDLDPNENELELGVGLLNKYPRVILSTNHQDSHVYVCKRSILDALQERPHFHSFREEFIPWLCKVHSHRAKYSKVLKPVTSFSSQLMALAHSTLSSHGRTSSTLLGLTDSPYQQHTDDGTAYSVGLHLASPLVSVLIHQANAGFASRANNLQSYLELNRHFLAEVSYSPHSDPQVRSLIDQTAQISPHSMIGDSTQVEERTTIKESIVGKHCIIGKTVRIVRCVILDHCVIGDGAKLDGCILGKNTKVGARAELIKCVTQGGYEVTAGDVYKNEKLDVSDWTTAPGGDSTPETGSDSNGSRESLHPLR